jgi:hypothetical protein
MDTKLLQECGPVWLKEHVQFLCAGHKDYKTDKNRSISVIFIIKPARFQRTTVFSQIKFENRKTAQT